MRRQFVPAVLALLCFGWGPACAHQTAEWTVMLWLNGDNSLQDAIVSDWIEAASVEDSPAVNVVVQLDRFEPDGTHRFLVRHSADPKLPDADIGERNMVAGNELAEFIDWTMRRYRARRYALIIGSHGNGPRFFQYGGAASLIPVTARGKGQRADIELPDGVFAAPTRAISADAHSIGDTLFNSEIAGAVRTALRKRPPLDLIGFDACLMGMVEVAYGMRNEAAVMVASEDLIQSEGWRYGHWLRQLSARPGMSAADLAQVLVDSFAETRLADRTLSAFRLERAEDLGRAISALSAALMTDVHTQKDVVRRARAKCAVFAPKKCGGLSCFHHIDLARFARLVGDDAAATPPVRVAAREVVSLVETLRIAHYAGPARASNDPSARDFGAEGLAIYFPETHLGFRQDKLTSPAYRKGSAQQFPIEFVEKEAWADFLQAYYRAVAHDAEH